MLLGPKRTKAIERVLQVMYPATREPDGTPMGDYQRRFAGDVVDAALEAALGEESFGELIERSSLGTPAAKAARASVSDEDARRVLARVRELDSDPLVCGMDGLTFDEHDLADTATDAHGPWTRRVSTDSGES